MNDNWKYRTILSMLTLILLVVGKAAFSHENSGYKFIENKGQWHEDVAFKASIPGGDLYVLNDRLKYVFYTRQHGGHEVLNENDASNSRQASSYDKSIHAIELSFSNSRKGTKVIGKGKSPEKINYIKGTDQKKWVQNAGAYAELEIENLYEGIDFVMYSTQGVLKYDFVVNPGSNPGEIQLKYEGQKAIGIHEKKLVLSTVHGQLIENVPVSFSKSNARTSTVRTEFELENDLVRFRFPDGYDETMRLVIDPELIFSTYSGSYADNWGFTATYDEEGNLYSGGIVADVGYPTTSGVFQPEFQGEWDVGILKYSPDGKDLIWATYLGGSFSETPQSIIVNSKGELIIYGTTSSPDFPMKDESFQQTFLGGDPIFDTTNLEPYRLVGGISMLNGTDVFLAILDSKGETLVGSTFIGGTENDGIMEKFKPLTKNYGDQFRGEVNIDSEDNIYVASNTSSPDFLIKDGPINVYGGGDNDGVVMKFNPDLSDLYWSTYAGGNGMDALFAIKVDLDGNVFAAGGSNSTDFPTTEGSHKPEKPIASDVDGVIVKIAGDGSVILEGTYVGTTNYDQVYFLELDSSNQVYVLGQTQGQYPVIGDVYSNANGGQFIHKLGNELDSTYFSTMIGVNTGSPDFSPTAFLVNECENIFISGWGGNNNSQVRGYIGGNTYGLPITANAFQSQTDGSDFYLMVLLQDAKQLLYATYFGEIGGNGDHVDGGTSRFDKRGIVYQSSCASCYRCINDGCSSTDEFPTYPLDVWSTTNNAFNCNNAAFKFDLANLEARFDTDAQDFTNRGIRNGCYPFPIVFLNESIGGEDFHWSFGEGTETDQEDSIFITYDNPGVYPVILTATDINTCVRESVATGNITVYDYNFGIMPDDSICYSDDIKLAASGGIYYDWLPKSSLQNANSSMPLASPDSTTVYTVSIEDQNGCTHEDSLEIKVIPEIFPDFSYEKAYDCHDTPVLIIENQSENASLFQWDFGDGNTSEEADPTHKYTSSDSLRTFMLTLVAGESFCSHSKSEEVTSVATFVPNFVSPNDDGKNDAFEITADDAIELHIYNRWGKEIYYAENYQNNWQPKDIASGVYFYEIIFDDKNTRCNGWVQVSR